MEEVKDREGETSTRMKGRSEDDAHIYRCLSSFIASLISSIAFHTATATAGAGGGVEDNYLEGEICADLVQIDWYNWI